MKRKKVFQAAALVCCALAASCGSAPMAPRQAEYAVLTVTTSDQEVKSTYPATIRGRQDIDIYAQVSGTISQLAVNEGQVVSKGQTLFIIDQVPYKAALQTAEANLHAAKASLATAQLTYDSKKELFARNVISATDLQMAENTLLAAQAQVAQAEAMRVNAANNLSYTVVKSPSNGVVGTLPYRAGALVGPSTPQPLTTVSDNSDMYVYFSMAENALLALTREHGSIAAALKAMPEVELKLNDGAIYNEKGRIESISGVIDPTTGSVQIRAVFPNKGRLLHSGSSGNVVVPSNLKNCIVIPQKVTFETQDKVYVYKILDGKAVSSIVSVTKDNTGRDYIVTDGLAVGDVILAEGVGLMREGTPIQPKQAAAPAAQNPADSTAAATNNKEK